MFGNYIAHVNLHLDGLADLAHKLRLNLLKLNRTQDAFEASQQLEVCQRDYAALVKAVSDAGKYLELMTKVEEE